MDGGLQIVFFFFFTEKRGVAGKEGFYHGSASGGFLKLHVLRRSVLCLTWVLVTDRGKRYKVQKKKKYGDNPFFIWARKGG